MNTLHEAKDFELMETVLTNGYCEISSIATNVKTVFTFEPFSSEVFQTRIFPELIQNLCK
jgi:hypothetical protein